jgi:hypothetical protein
MPDIRVKTEVDINVEVYCDTCGTGLCNVTKVDSKHSDTLRVRACPTCMSEKDMEIDLLNKRIEELLSSKEN